ncbi:hypothetical protein [Edwardsiella ictaluri]|uniref:hypothetical protein n=2 Tax=Edwardsiella ictaluri TaxID=67780 RepID=UPI0018DEA627|nr:hypothetical protein [Edwardsiella ictaluri]QPW30185.1 hypothetical protein F8539_09480 [Edwardsiella ictaluri]UYB60314.1 hypothetical protein N8I66_09360 [Edwardsiella ictaluri]UYB63541.1 hypothetical protein N8I67_09355 [Edwardsiella ictaluri]WJH21211.1 hypothetical protein FGU63_09485 [Edwardsiella ictaluri]
MTQLISSLLKQIGPCLSSVLVEEMLKKSTLNSTAARKQISRAVATGKLHCVDNLFPKRERFIYLAQQYGSGDYWRNLTTALLGSSSAYGLALSCLRARGGILKLEHFAAACGSPVAMKKRLSWSSVLEGLLQHKMVRKVNLSSIGDCVALTEKNEDSYHRAVLPLKARLTTESILMKAVGQWVKNTGIISYDTLRTRELVAPDQIPCVSNFCFDISAASYLNPLLQYTGSGEPRPGFFVCDLLLGSKLNLQHVQPFITKCRSISSLNNSPRCLYMFIADEYSTDAFSALKKAGIIPATPETLFGNDLAEALVQLRELISYMSSSLNGNITTIDEIMSKLSRIEGATTQLQGDLFEYIVAEAVRIDHSHVEVGRLCKSDDDRKADCDVLALKGRSLVTFIECKGYKPYSTVRHKDIERWISYQIPVFRKHAQREYPEADVVVELWTTGKFSDDTRDMLKKFTEQNNINQRYSIHIVEPHEIRNRIKATRNTSLVRVFEKHFINNMHTATARRRTPEPVRLAGHDEADEYNF